MADFIGFTLNGIHSSDLHITRTSDGSRFTKNLLPGISDMTSYVNGHDGMYYWGRDFKNYTISINIAYDDLEEKYMRKLQQLLQSRKPLILIFDETPYMKWYVLPTTNCKLNYVCFSKYEQHDVKKLYTPGTDSGLGRVYKGEGNLAFTTLEPFARSTDKYKDDYTAVQLYDWNDAVGLKTSDGLDTWSTNKFVVYNPSDKPAMPIVSVEFTNGSTTDDKTLVFALGTSNLKLANIELDEEDTGIVVNCET